MLNSVLVHMAFSWLLSGISQPFQPLQPRPSPQPLGRTREIFADSLLLGLCKFSRIHFLVALHCYFPLLFLFFISFFALLLPPFGMSSAFSVVIQLSFFFLSCGRSGLFFCIIITFFCSGIFGSSLLSSI